MSVVKFSRVISCSSEDPKFPANNLLKLEMARPWKCKDRGEKQAIVILEFERACKIDSIDVGNENSAFIEIFVGKSAMPDTYEILRVSSLLMSVQDSKNEKNKNGVRFFKREEFADPTIDQSWDRIKIICTQPFNKTVQYGLAFLRVHSENEAANDQKPSAGTLTAKNEEETSSEQKNETSVLGKFVFKKDDESCNVAVGSLFARRNDEPLSAAAAIRAASNNPNSITSSAPLKRLSDLIPNARDAKRKRKPDDTSNSDDCRRSTTGPLLYADDLSDDDESARRKKRDSNNSKENSKNKLNSNPDSKQDKQKKNQVKPNDDNQPPKTPKRNNSRKNDQTNDVPKKKPFNRLLEGVVFVISGYQNPYRSDLRSKALSLGARYKADWNSECTHLICAFANTPKSAQVLGNGWIVKNTWVEDCYTMRKRLPCADYKLNPNDPFTSPDDEEIWEGTDDPKPAPVSPKQPERSTVKQVNIGSSSQDSRMSVSPEKETKENEIYDADTDVDSDYSNTIVQSDYENISLKVLPDLFADKKFYLGPDLPQNTISMLQRYVIAYKGNVSDDADNSDYIITEDSQHKKNLMNTPVLLPDWIWECNDQKKLVPTDHYLL